MAGPSPYNRKLKAKNDRRKARAAYGPKPGSAAYARESAKRGGGYDKDGNRRIVKSPVTVKGGRPGPVGPQDKPRRARRTKGPIGPQMREKDYERLFTERSFEERDNPIAKVVSAVSDLIDSDAERAARVVTNPDSTYGDRVASAAPLPGPATVKAGKLALSGLKTASGVGKGAERTRKAAAAANKIRKDPKKVSEAARGAAKKTGKKARRTGQKAKTPEGRREIAKGTAKGAGRAGKRAGKRAAESRVPPLLAAPVVADEAGVSGETVDKASALAKGTVMAPINYPAQYAATTGRGILGLGVAFGQAAYAGGNTVVRGARSVADKTGTPYVGADYSPKEVVAPVTDLVKQDWEGTKDIGRELLSGDQERVEKAYANELGGIAFVPAPWLVRKARNSKGYQSVRSSARDRASKKVKKQREQAAEEAARDADKMPKADRRGRDKTKKKPRSAIVDPTTRSEEYLLSNLPGVRSVGGRAVAKKIQRRNIRKAVSLQSGMETQIEAKTTILDDKDIQAKVGQVAAPAKGRNAFFRKVEEAVFVVANRGIPFSQREALEWIGEVRADKTPDTQEVGGVRESRVLDFIEENPQILSDPAFQDAVKQATGILDETTTSQRAKYLPVALPAGIATPETRLAEGVEVGGRIVKETVTDPRKWEEWKGQVRLLRAESRKKESEGDIEGAMADRAKAAAISRRLNDARKGYRKAESEFIAETEAFIAERGLRTPARLTDSRKTTGESVKDKVAGVRPGARKARTSRVTKKSEGILLREDTADRSREGVWNDSILGPRLQRIYHSLTKTVIRDYGYKITILSRDGKPRKVLEATSREHQAALDRGELPDDIILIDAQRYRAATGDKGAGLFDFQDLLNAFMGRTRTPDDEMPPVISGADELRELARQDRAAEPGRKYIAVNPEAVEELVGQIEGVQGSFSRAVAKGNRGASNVILGYNPSFIGAQQIAEGGPALTAAMTANPASIARMAKAAPNRTRGTNRERAQREAMYGISGGTFQFRQPNRGAVVDRVDQLTEPRLTKPSKALGVLKDAARGKLVNDIVLRTGASYRRLVGLAELDRRSKRTIGSLGKLVTRFGALERKFKGKSLSEVENYFAANPRLRAEIRSYLNDVMGDFSTLTRLEARFAPGIAFYPYLRYSLRWGFYAFPQRHPVRASILYFLSQVNAEQLEHEVEKLVGNGKVTDWLDYSYPVVSKDGEPYPLPGGSRFAPAGSNVFQAIPFLGEGNSDRLLGSLNPVVGAILNAAYGRDSFSGEKVAGDYLEKLLLGASAFAAMAAPLRAIDEADIELFGVDINPISAIKPRKDGAGYSVGKESEAGKEFDSYDPNRIERGFSPVGPLIGQSASDYRKTNRKAKRMKRGDYSSGSSSSSSSSSSSDVLTSPWGSSGSDILTNPFD